MFTKKKKNHNAMNTLLYILMAMRKRNSTKKAFKAPGDPSHKGHPAKHAQTKKKDGVHKELGRVFVHTKKADITEEDLTGMMKVRYLLGKIFETVQYLEYNLSLSLRYSLILKNAKNLPKPISVRTMQDISKNVEQTLKLKKIDLQTFGNLISTLSESKVLEKPDLDELEEILQTRNILAHQYFKKNRFEEQEKNKAFLEGQANYLLHFQNRVMNLNDRIFALLKNLAAQIGKLS